MINILETLFEDDRGVREAELYLQESNVIKGRVPLDQLNDLANCVQVNVGNIPYMAGLTDDHPQSAPHLIQDYQATNADIIQQDIDLSWVPKEYKEFCKYLQPSKTTFNFEEYAPFDYQVAIAEKLEDPNVKTVNVYKSRQTGLSEFVVSYILFKFLVAAKTGDQFSVMVYSTTQKDATALGDRMLIMYNNLIRGIEEDGRILRGPDFDRDSATEKTINGGRSKVNFMATTGGRGTPAVDLVVVDESDFIPDIGKVLKAAKPTLGASGGKIITITTPNGEGGYACKELNSIDSVKFAEMIEHCKEENSSGWGLFTDHGGANVGAIVHYSAHPFYNSDWAKTQKDELKYDDASWNQEYELSTIASGSMYFNHAQAELCYSLVSSLKSDYRNIVMGVDPSGGGADNTAITVWGERKSDGVKILIEEFYDPNIGTIATTEKIYELYTTYYPSAVVIESNGVGYSLPELVERKLDGLCDVVAVNTSHTHKTGILQLMRTEMFHRRVGYRQSSSFRSEIYNFLQKERPNGKFKYEARTGFHDDAIMASCHALNHLVNNPSPVFVT